MKKILLITSIIFTLNSVAYAQIPSTSVDWLDSIDYAKKLAESQNKPLAIFFMRNPASFLDTSVLDNTLSNPAVVEIISANFIPVVVRGDVTTQTKYNISNKLPALVFLTYKDVELSRIEDSSSFILDRTLAVLDTVKSNYAVQYKSASKNSSNTSVYSGPVMKFSYGNKSSFSKTGDKTWVHKTPFYTVDYLETPPFDDTRHYYLVSKDKKVYVAVPKSAGAPIWIWDISLNQWTSTSDEITAVSE